MYYILFCYVIHKPIKFSVQNSTFDIAELTRFFIENIDKVMQMRYLNY